MHFFTVKDGDGGSVADRYAIAGVIVLAFSWIPIMLTLKCISVMRRKGPTGNENGNTPVTTKNSDPEKNPYHPGPQPQGPIAVKVVQDPRQARK